MIYTRELHPSGLRFQVMRGNEPVCSTLLGEQGPAVALLAASLSSLLEERLVAEAPWMMFMRGYYYLFYSSGWTTEVSLSSTALCCTVLRHQVKYHIRVAVSRSPTGPFTRAPRPVITTDWNRFAQVSRHCFDCILTYLLVLKYWKNLCNFIRSAATA